MAEKHSGWSRTSRGARANSQGAPRVTRTDPSRSRVDLDGVPLRHTGMKDEGILPPEFYALFRVDPAAAIAKDWTVNEAS